MLGTSLFFAPPKTFILITWETDMYIIQPWLLTTLAAVVMAVVMLVVFWQRSNTVRAVAAASGLAVGALGTALFMVPLGYCAFETERSYMDYLLGAMLIATGIGLAFVIARWLISRISAGESIIPKADTYRGAFGGRFSILAAVFLLPTLIILSVFHYYPLASSFRLSTRLIRLGAPRSKFVCLDNFSNLFVNPEYWYTIFFTLVVTVGVVVFAMSSALVIAQMANLPIQGANIYRALLIWPIAISPVVAGVLFQLILNQYSGIVNHLLDSTFGFRINWLGQPQMATLSIILTAAWNQTGFNILFYIAGLRNVSHELVEAAYIDGANPWQAFARITWPLLSPFTFFLIVTNTIYAFFATFGIIDILTRGGPVDATTSAMYRVYLVGIQAKDLGKGAAQSLVLFIIIIFITILQFRTSNRQVSYGG